MIERRYPMTRLRRTRANPAIRALVSETTLTPKDLIQPLFITAAPSSEPIASMPGLSRLNRPDLLHVCEQILTNGLHAIALFPAIDPAFKSRIGEYAWEPKGLMPETIRTLKKQFPELLIMADVALDPYTTHGHDGILNAKGGIDNDATCDALIQQALCLSESGADILGPSDMMDGRIGKIREQLEQSGHTHTLILSYAAKYASVFYGPFRGAVQSNVALGEADKKTYQMDPANTNEALAEVAQDLAEGADMILVKPAMLYLDVLQRVKATFQVPTWGYQVSGEYAMIHHAVTAGDLDRKAAILESLLCIKRAGADAILSYFALEASAWL